MPTLRVILPGLLSTIQDLGRAGAQRHGVPTSGAMDPFALAAANRLVGNPPGAAALEITSGGALFELRAPTLLALAGADLGATLDGAPVSTWTAIMAGRGAQLALPARQGGWGARAYLALAGGIAVPPMLGSRSTYLPGAFGGLEGRQLRAGDELAAAPVAYDIYRLAGQRWPAAARPAYGPTPLLRLVPGPHLDCFEPGALAALAAATLRVSPDSNRMGYRLLGASLPHARPSSLPSLGVIPGVVQVPPDGTPILLMADAQTTGGYPIAGTLAGADLPLAAQLLPGDALRFAPVSLEEALAARRALAGWLAAAPIPAEELPLLALAGMPG